MKIMKKQQLDDALKAIGQNHPFDSITDREALDTALWFGSRGMHKWVHEHQSAYPEAWCALEYITSLKADPVKLGMAVDTGVFSEGLGLLMDEAKRNLVFGAQICPTFYNIMYSGTEVGISDEQIQELVQLVDDIGSYWGFTIVRIGNNVWLVPAYGVSLPD